MDSVWIAVFLDNTDEMTKIDAFEDEALAREMVQSHVDTLPAGVHHVWGETSEGHPCVTLRTRGDGYIGEIVLRERPIIKREREGRA